MSDRRVIPRELPKRTKKYEDLLADDLRDPDEAAAYLNAALDELDEPDGLAVFLMALGDVVRAQGVSSVTRSVKLGRESTYKALSATGNPKLKSVLSLLRGTGLRLLVAPQPRQKPRPPHTKTKSRPALAKAS